MERKGILKKVISMVLMLVLSAGLVFVSAPESYAASSSGKLVKTVKHYYKSGSKWKWSSTTTYKYNSKKDPTSITETYKVGKKKHKIRYTYKYTYEKGKKVEAKEYIKEDDGAKSLNTKTEYDSKGRPSVVKFYDPDDSTVPWSTTKYTYGKNGYITKIKNSNDSVVIKYKWNGKKAKALKSYMIIDGHKSKLAQTKFNKKGYVERPEVYTQADPLMTFTYKYKNSLVKTANLKMQDGYSNYYEKYKISYTKKSIPMKRYRAMINAALCGNYPEAIGTVWF